MDMKNIDFDTKVFGVSIAVLFVTMWNAMAGFSLAVAALIMTLLHYLREHRRLSRDRRLLVVAAIAALLSVAVVVFLHAIGA
jgi:O-antigen/teichoic acid export membrane protein